MEDIPLSEINPKINTSKVSVLCLIMLFILRVPILGFLSFFLDQTYKSSIYMVFMIGTYFFTALFIWVERYSLIDYHIDTIPLMIFTIGPLWFLGTDIKVRIPMIIMGIILLVALKRAKCKLPRITRNNLIWLFIGIIAGIITAIISGYFISKQVTNTGVKATYPLFIALFLTQLTNAAIIEEPFFRGCLWGFLKKMKCNEIIIYLIQAGLFWIGHIYYFKEAPYSFWIVVPLGGLVLGFLAWRSRSIGTSMVAHGITNGLGQLLTFYKFY